MKTNVGLIYGGISGEHEISKLSACSVLKALNKDKYEVFAIAIDKHGNWFLNDVDALLGNATNSLPLSTNAKALTPKAIPSTLAKQVACPLSNIDVFLPIMHGPLYEDGCLQGLFELMNKPYVGANVASSAISMDKVLAKTLVAQAGISVAPYSFLTIGMREEVRTKILRDAMQRFGFPLFVKPAAMGSSVGISKVRCEDELVHACQKALQFDEKVLIEQAVIGQEVELGLLGELGQLEASVPGEIRLHSDTDFYSYEAKYLDDQAIELLIPARVSTSMVEKLKAASIEIGNVLGIEGMSRVDFFVTKDEGLIFNEINTIPGFTAYSMYPKLWQESGVQYAELLDRLIDTAILRHERRQGIVREKN